MNIEVVCINDKGRPADHPASLWPKEGDLYTVVKVSFLIPQNIQAVELEEFDLTGQVYTYFRADRFAPVSDLSAMLEEVKQEAYADKGIIEQEIFDL